VGFRSTLRQVDVPCGTDGKWRIEKMTVDRDGSAMSFITGHGRGVPPGEYTALYRGGDPSAKSSFSRGVLVMSDTPDELRDHIEPVNKAKGGHVLIAGLGIGCVLQAVLDKPEVERATVIEKAPEVIRLVGPHYKKRYGDRLEIVEADIFEWQPPKGVRYSVAWFDIWDDICSDNLDAMTKLKRKFARRAEWKGCWCEWRCRRHSRAGC